MIDIQLGLGFLSGILIAMVVNKLIPIEYSKLRESQRRKKRKKEEWIAGTLPLVNLTAIEAVHLKNIIENEDFDLQKVDELEPFQNLSDLTEKLLERLYGSPPDIPIERPPVQQALVKPELRYPQLNGNVYAPISVRELEELEPALGDIVEFAIEFNEMAKDETGLYGSEWLKERNQFETRQIMVGVSESTIQLIDKLIERCEGDYARAEIINYFIVRSIKNEKILRDIEETIEDFTWYQERENIPRYEKAIEDYS